MDGLKRAKIKRGAQHAQATKIWNKAELLINGEMNEVNIEKLRVILATYDAKIELLRKLDETVSDLIEDEKGLETEIFEADDYLTELTKKRCTIELFINQSTIHSNSLDSHMATTTPQNGHVFPTQIKDPTARKNIVFQAKLCFNCLNNHRVSDCNSRNRCRGCHKKHHTSLCNKTNKDATKNTGKNQPTRRQNPGPCPHVSVIQRLLWETNTPQKLPLIR
ncbi:Hypothetical predicted protein [Paramuricea clavata]|uniref:Uncharacterized protein n=1 Tax=Paramuricea clavata TaxID=317549 RepID=A0A6S7G397_PARCT|nr:Hypothetical predicted protein [Paramuricea clavata]